MGGSISIFKAALIILALWVCSAEGYVRPAHIREEIWNEVEPYLIEETDPVKEILDEIFTPFRAILTDKSLKKAGFTNAVPRKWTHVIVTTHPRLPGYVIKLYLDVQRYFKQVPEYVHWIQRIQGRNLIEQLLDQNGWNHLFKVPKKWIYVLPAKPLPPKEFIRKNFLLIEEDMEILADNENHEAWNGEKVTQEFLDIFYTLLETGGLRDMAKPANAPFCKDGKIAFIDTQGFYDWPVSYYKLHSFLSPEMLKHWKKLTK